LSWPSPLLFVLGRDDVPWKNGRTPKSIMLIVLLAIAAAVVAYATWEFLPRFLDDRERTRRRMMKMRSTDFAGAVELAKELLAAPENGRRGGVYRSAAESIILEDAERRGDTGEVATRLASLINKSPMNGVPLVTRLARAEAVLEVALRQGAVRQSVPLAAFVETNAVASRVPSDHHRTRMRSLAGLVLAHGGELDRGAALQPFDGTNIYSSATPRPLTWASEVASLRGEVALATRLADEGVRLAFGPYTSTDSLDRVFALAQASEAHLAAGDAEGALALARRATIDVQPSAHNFDQARYGELLLRVAESAALVTNGKHDDAVQLVARLLVVIDQAQLPFVRAKALAVAAKLAAATDDRTEFTRLQNEAVSALDGTGALVAAAATRANLSEDDTGVVGEWPSRPM